MARKIQILVGIFLFGLLNISECKAQTAAEVVFYHHRSLTHQNHQQQDNFPLYPVGDEIPNLPKPIAKDETDLKVIQKYYNDVAKAFFAAAEQLEDKASHNLEKIKTGQAQVSWASVRTGEKGPFSRKIGDATGGSKIDVHTDKAQRVDINYKGDMYKNSLNDANVWRNKGEFYAELADTAQQLNEGIIGH